MIVHVNTFIQVLKKHIRHTSMSMIQVKIQYIFVYTLYLEYNDFKMNLFTLFRHQSC